MSALLANLGGGLASTASGASFPAQTASMQLACPESILDGLDHDDPSLVNATYVVGDILSGLQDHSPMRDAYGIRRAIDPARR